MLTSSTRSHYTKNSLSFLNSPGAQYYYYLDIVHHGLKVLYNVVSHYIRSVMWSFTIEMSSFVSIPPVIGYVRDHMKVEI